ncbi:unnamed protein product [Eruca vesicaria subsp. sativa]|uniref:Uncharacterized protein n=1 Tax=Eruca vesicaria subsp. sativa TaxID=29727 RepID=A0ABC8KIG0_ERUVS|nr:unnamed protein product [Eruca vesicaria subsp. sativa]
MVFGTFLEHNSHHHHHHHHRCHLHLHLHRGSMAEKPRQVMEYEDLSNVMKVSSHHKRKVKSDSMAKDEDIDKEADNFIKLEHLKFNKWT